MELLRATLAFLGMRNSFLIIEMHEPFIHLLCWVLTIFETEKVGGGGHNQNYLIFFMPLHLNFTH